MVFVKIKEKIEEPTEENTSVLKPKKMKEGKEGNAEIDKKIPRLILNQTQTLMKLLVDKAVVRQSRKLGGQKEGTFSTPYLRRLRLLGDHGVDFCFLCKQRHLTMYQGQKTWTGKGETFSLALRSFRIGYKTGRERIGKLRKQT